MVDVIVPDFAKDAVSMSGVALGLAPERPVSGGDALKGLLPMLPTAQREFRQYDAVTAVFYAYQRTSPFQPAQLTMRITDIKNEVVVTEKQTIAADRFSVKESPGAAEVRYLVPLERLAAGPYLLTIETTTTESTFRRDVQFTVR
jgi:hypothetical protein